MSGSRLVRRPSATASRRTRTESHRPGRRTPRGSRRPERIRTWPRRIPYTPGRCSLAPCTPPEDAEIAPMLSSGNRSMRYACSAGVTPFCPRANTTTPPMTVTSFGATSNTASPPLARNRAPPETGGRGIRSLRVPLTGLEIRPTPYRMGNAELATANDTPGTLMRNVGRKPVTPALATMKSEYTNTRRYPARVPRGRRSTA